MGQKEQVEAVAIITAAGQGVRMAADLPKVLMSLGERPMLAQTLLAFEKADHIARVIVVTAKELLGPVAQDVVDAHGLHKVQKIVPGGAARQESVYAGLQAIDGACQLVAIHDGARPLITADLIDLTVERAAQYGAAALAVRPKDTLRRGESDHFLATLDRERIWQMQTPQVFSHDMILSAHQQAVSNGFLGTDDVSLVEAIGERVYVVEGRYENLKVTTPEDLVFAEAILKRRVAV